jgi:hypothetical protein
LWQQPFEAQLQLARQQRHGAIALAQARHHGCWQRGEQSSSGHLGEEQILHAIAPGLRRQPLPAIGIERVAERAHLGQRRRSGRDPRAAPEQPLLHQRVLWR